MMNNIKNLKNSRNKNYQIEMKLLDGVLDQDVINI